MIVRGLVDLPAAVPEHREWLDAGRPVGDSRRFAVLRGADLRGADLSGADLRGADLSGAVLRGAVLSDAVLRGADLRGADLSRADLSRAVLSRAVLRRADLSRADLSGADLSRADLSRAVLAGTCLDPVAPIPPIPDAALSGFEVRVEDGVEWVYGWRTAHSQHCGETVYQPGQTYTAPWFSVCPETDCHPGIYMATRQWLAEEYSDAPLVRCRAKRADLHRAGAKFRARQLEILETAR